MTDFQLIKNHTVFFAYFCYLLDSNQVDVADELCEIGWKLDEEIRKRKITDSQIKECITNTELNPQDQLMVATYIYPGLDLFNIEIGQT